MFTLTYWPNVAVNVISNGPIVDLVMAVSFVFSLAGAVGARNRR